MRIERVPLPGVGTRARFATQAGRWIGVILHADGQRELLVYSVHDSDTVQTTVRLTEQEAHELAEILFSHHNGGE
jgi:Putative regulatory, ligand-binding protein related to C-terminal domains of K+ channels